MESEATLHSLESRDSLDSLHSVSDDELLRRLGDLVSHSRRVEVDLVAHIGEVEERRLYAREASPSMFAYSTKVLHLSEAEAYLRITVARAARRHPPLLTMLGDGRLHLSGIVKLVPILTRENRDVLLKRATHLSKRQILELVAELSPRPDAPSVMRKLPQGRPAPTLKATQSPNGAGPGVLELGPDGVGPSPTPTVAPGLATTVVPPPAPSRPAVVEPLSPDRYKVQFTASAQLRDKLERLTALMRSEVPDGDLAAIIEKVVTEKLERIEARRYATTSAADDAPSETGSSFTIDTRLAWAETTAQATLHLCARATIATWPSATTARRP